MPKRKSVRSVAGATLLMSGGLLAFWILATASFGPRISVSARMASAHRAVMDPFRISMHWESLLGPPLVGEVPRKVVFTDYECSACIAKWTAERNVDGVVVRHYPLAIHPVARAAAAGVICASEQGKEREMHEALLQHPQTWRLTSDVRSVARSLGRLKLDGWDTCITHPRTGRRLAADSALASKLAIRGIPATVTRMGIEFGAPDNTTR